MNTNVASQMELTLTGANTAPAERRLQPARPTRAAWWFSRMREVVDNAVTWVAKPTHRTH
jgi:hypothetical protein